MHILPPVVHEGSDSYGEFGCLAEVLPEVPPVATVPPFDPSCEDYATIASLLPPEVHEAAEKRARRLWTLWKKGSRLDAETADSLIDDAVRWVWHFKWLCAQGLGGEVFRGCKAKSPDLLLQGSNL